MKSARPSAICGSSSPRHSGSPTTTSWNKQINNHITARLTDHSDRFLMNPFGLGWDEITASNLVTIDFNGEVLSHDGVKLAPAGYNFHSGILKARPDLNCVIHVHATPGVVIAATKGGLQIVDQSGCHLYGEVAGHDFEGFAQEQDEVPRILERPRRQALPADVEPRPAHGRPHRSPKASSTCADWWTPARSTSGSSRPAPRSGRSRRTSWNSPATRSPRSARAPAYSDSEWRYHLRLAERLDPSFAE